MQDKYADPFEQFRKKKLEEASEKGQNESSIEFEVEAEGKPKGFVTHRHNYGHSAPERISVDKPQKFASHKFEKKEEIKPDTIIRPKGFTVDKVGGKDKAGKD